MKKSITIGDFNGFGANRVGDTVTFTYELPQLGDSKILLFHSKSFKCLHEIRVPKEFHMGRVISVSISGYNWDHLCYLYEIDGKKVVDPYAKTIVGRDRWMDVKRQENLYQVYGGFENRSYTWKEQRPVIDASDMIIYKLHMRGFTMQHGLHASLKGNYKGIIALLPELKELGVTSLEFMPLYDFEDIFYHSHFELDENYQSVLVAEPPMKTNYWGYGNAAYFAPKASFFGGSEAPIHCKEMVEAIHNAGMEVIMEFSFTGEASDDLIMDALKFWAKEYHVDGFHLLGAGLPAKRIATEPFLGASKIFYDQFPRECLLADDGMKHLFAYNDFFQYPLRRLQNHMDGNVNELAGMMRRQEEHSGYINFISNNNGFTLMDVFTYGEKHNEANGEENRDGSNYNCSFNFGQEGPTNNRMIQRIRYSNMRTAMAILLLSQGVPQILSGDEVANSAMGNNNPYCQDNEVGWVNFSKRKSALKLRDYVRELIAFRKAHSVLSLPEPMQQNDYLSTGLPDLSYHGREPWIMGIGDEKKAVGILYNGAYGTGKKEEDVMVCINFYYGEEAFALPKLLGSRKWYQVTNTGEDVWNPSKKPLSNQSEVLVPGGTVTILVGKK